MKKFLNFSTILCSYILITLLVISCGGSDGNDGSSSSDGTSGNDGTSSGDGSDVSGGVPQPEPKDTTCLLPDRGDKDSLIAVLCYDGVVIAKIAKDATETQQLDFLIPSTESSDDKTSRTWDISTAREIQISYNKDYTLTVDEPTRGASQLGTLSEGASQLGTLSDVAEHTAEFPLQNLTIASLLNDTKEALRSGGITFSLASGSAIKVAIAPKLAVKNQADFRSMGSVVSIPDLTLSDYQVPFVLENDLNLVAPGGEGDRFDSSIIPVVNSSFDFDGGGYTISLNSAIDVVSPYYNYRPDYRSAAGAAIIGRINRAVTLKNFILDVNKPILSNTYVGSLVGLSSDQLISKLHDIKININKNISVYRLREGLLHSFLHIGGVAGVGCFDINNVVVKTAKDVAIQADVTRVSFSSDIIDDDALFSGGLVGINGCDNKYVHINNNVVDVTLGFSYYHSSAASSARVEFGGLASSMFNVTEINNNLVKLAISRGNLPAKFRFYEVGGLSKYIWKINQVTNNLVYLDFSNLGKVVSVGGLFDVVGGGAYEHNKTANNMLFIADGFTGSEVYGFFGVAIGYIGSFDDSFATQFNDNFFSSPVTAYTNAKLASLARALYSDMTFNNLILDNKDAAVMFKDGTYSNNARNRVSGANLFTLADAKTNDVSALFSAGNTSWEEGSQGYPQLKAPWYFSEAHQADWDRINDLIQAGLADRAARANQ